jgi:mannose-6-phosphate isomerase-like protein (cupin superfamily)/ketosteroid isomerase-like protein
VNSIENAIAIVQNWHDALNSGDVDRLATLLADDVEFGGPRGSGHGAAMVVDWARRAGIHLEPRRWFQRDGDVVVVQSARWRAPETGELGDPIDTASVFQIRDGRVLRVARYETLADALAAAGLDESTEVHLSSHPNANGQGATVAPHLIDITALPYVGSSHELEGYLHGDTPVSLIFFDGAPGSGPRLHRHPYPEIFITLEGAVTFTIGGESLEVAAGQIAIAPAGVPHKFINSGDGPLRQIDIHASDRFITEWLEE